MRKTSLKASCTAGCGGLLTAALISLAASVPNGMTGEQRASWQRLHLAESTLELGHCGRPVRDTEAAIILHNEADRAVQIGAEFSVLVSPSRIRRGRVVALVTPDECETLYEPYPVPRAVLQLDGPIDRDTARDGLVAVAGEPVLPAQVGTIAALGNQDRDRYLAIIRKRFPPEPVIDVRTAVRFTMPGSAGQYVFVRVAGQMEHRNQRGDPRGLVFADGSPPRLLLAEPRLSELLAVVDLDRDGVAELVATDRRSGEVWHEVRLFDGQRLSEWKKLLLYWEH